MTFVPVTEIESATGLSKEVIRKWESRYGFPSPDRDGNGERLYPLEQVDRLRLMRRLLDTGQRPGKLVSLSQTELESLVGQASEELLQHLAPTDRDEDFLAGCISLLKGQEMAALSQLLEARLDQEGLESFCRLSMPLLLQRVGEAWLGREIRIYEEHLFSQTLTDLLARILLKSKEAWGGHPRLLLATPPGEMHVLGLTLARVLLSLWGADCVMLGAQAPAPEIVDACQALDIHGVALSFSLFYPLRNAQHFLTDLREALPPEVALWAGGMGVARLERRPQGVDLLPSFDQAYAALQTLRSNVAKRAG